MIEGLTFQSTGTSPKNNGSLHKNGVLGVKEDIKDLTAEQREVLIYATTENPLPVVFQDISKDIKIKDFFKEPIASLNKDLKDAFKSLSTDISKTIKEVNPEEDDEYSPFENEIVKQSITASTKIDNIFKVLQDLSSKEIEPQVKEEVVNNIESNFKEVQFKEKEINNKETLKTVTNNNNEVFKEIVNNNNNNEIIKEINNKTEKEINNNDFVKEINNTDTIENNIFQKSSIEKETISKEFIKDAPVINIEDSQEAKTINSENIQLDKNLTIEKVLSSTIPDSLKEGNEISLDNSKTFKNILETLKENKPIVTIKNQFKESNKEEDNKINSTPKENIQPENLTFLEKIKNKVADLSDTVLRNMEYSSKISNISGLEAIKMIKNNDFPENHKNEFKEIKKDPELIKEKEIIKEQIKETDTFNDKEVLKEEINNTSLPFLENIIKSEEIQTDILSSILKSIDNVTELNSEKVDIKAIDKPENIIEVSTTSKKAPEVHLTDYLKEESKKEETSATKLYEKMEGSDTKATEATLNSMDNISNILKDNGELLSKIIEVLVEANKEKPSFNKDNSNKVSKIIEETAGDIGGVPSIVDMATGMFKMIR